jgi:hypothetical protein
MIANSPTAIFGGLCAKRASRQMKTVIKKIFLEKGIGRKQFSTPPAGIAPGAEQSRFSTFRYGGILPLIRSKACIATGMKS